MAEDQDLTEQIAQAGARLDPALTERDVERLVAGALRRRQRRAGRRRLALGLGVGGLAVASLLAVGRFPHEAHVSSRPQPRETASLVSQPHGAVTFADGSRALPLDPLSALEVTEDGVARTEVVLTRGNVRFEVVPRSTRSFVVRVADVTITVLGTVFTVERVADRIGLSVERGTVQVAWVGGSRVVQAGESNWYPPLVSSSLAVRPQAKRSRPAESAAVPEKVARSRAREPRREVASAEDLLAAADEARLAGHPAEGAARLETLLRVHREDARAPWAAFTLGRMLLRELGRPREAAAAFAEARRLSPRGPLAEDALAREVEALVQAADRTAAKNRAAEYLRLYPQGRRAAAVQEVIGAHRMTEDQ